MDVVIVASHDKFSRPHTFTISHNKFNVPYGVCRSRLYQIKCWHTNTTLTLTVLSYCRGEGVTPKAKAANNTGSQLPK